MAAPHDDYREQNRRSWNAATPAHNRHKRDQAGFLRTGGSTLFVEEIELLGELRGRRLVHLQCNSGQDTLSLARLGARVVGVDIADEAVAFARRLAAESGIGAEFVHAEVLDWLATTAERFDVAFASYGAIGWIGDLGAWMRGVRRVLRPGGRLVLLEFHPLVWCLDGTGRVVEPYFADGPIVEPDGVGDYVARSGDALAPMGRVEAAAAFANPEPSVSFQWTVAQTVQHAIDAGLRITALREYPHSNGCRIWAEMEPLAGRRFAAPRGVAAVPMMLGLVACRDA